MDDMIMMEQVRKSTMELGQLIQLEYEKSSGRIINGYVLFENPSKLMKKRELRKYYKLGMFRSITECDLPVYEKYPEHVRPLVSMLIGYMVRNNLQKELENYHFKKMIIYTDMYRDVPVYELRIEW